MTDRGPDTTDREPDVGAREPDEARERDEAREPDEDGIARLLRLTGPRPAVPAERAQRVRRAVHARWRTGLRARATRRTVRFGALAAAAVIAVGLGIVSWRLLATPAPAAIAGHIEIGSAALLRGSTIRPGARLDTGPDERVALRLASGHSVRLDAATRIEIGSGRALRLLEGALYVDSVPPPGTDSLPSAAEPIAIETPAGVIHDAGTQFAVRIGDPTARTGEPGVRIGVREGAVSIERVGGTTEVAAGEEVILGRGEVIARRALAANAPEWDWAAGVAPMPAIDGRPLRAFLDWIAREQGLALRFARSDLEGTAAATRLAGSIEGMTLDQALESVLLTCRMTSRVEGGTLLIQPRL